MPSLDPGRPRRRSGRNAASRRVLLGILVGLLFFSGFGATVVDVVTWGEADEAGRAPTCKTSDAIWDDDCLSWTNATIVSFVDISGKHSDHSLTVRDKSLDPGITAATYTLTFQSGNALLAADRIGTTVQVETWQGEQITVKSGSVVLETEDNPQLQRTQITAGALLCFGFGSLIAALVLGSGGGGASGAGRFSAVSVFRRRRGSPGGFAAAARIGVVCWSVAAVVTAIVLLNSSGPTSVAFALVAGATVLVDLIAVASFAVTAFARYRARGRDRATIGFGDFGGSATGGGLAG